MPRALWICISPISDSCGPGKQGVRLFATSAVHTPPGVLAAFARGGCGFGNVGVVGREGVNAARQGCWHSASNVSETIYNGLFESGSGNQHQKSECQLRLRVAGGLSFVHYCFTGSNEEVGGAMALACRLAKESNPSFRIFHHANGRECSDPECFFLCGTIDTLRSGSSGQLQAGAEEKIRCVNLTRHVSI